MSLKTPILFMVFNRPDTTKIVFDRIRKVQPSKLYIAADGPREGVSTDEEKVKTVREIVSNIDWDCTVSKLFRQKNLGCRNAVSEAITWFFDQESKGIILEDDCLPHPDFFPFCTELLERYCNNPHIMMISGVNFQNRHKRGNASYYFARYPHIWGWATWQRVWKLYDVEMKSFDDFKSENQIANIIDEPAEQEYWMKQFELVHSKKLDTWDYQFVYTTFINQGLCINPNVNLISNIGFNNDATHTRNNTDRFANMPVLNLGKMIHPKFILPNREAETHTKKYVLNIGRGERIGKLRKLWPRK
jgi:hypothetical protein